MSVPLPVAGAALSPGTGYSKSLVSNRIAYKDGYSQSSPRGIRPVPQVWQLVWNDISLADILTLDEFFTELHRTGGTFSWTPVGQSTPREFEPNGEFSSTYDDKYNLGNVRMTVREVQGV